MAGRVNTWLYGVMEGVWVRLAVLAVILALFGWLLFEIRDAAEANCGAINEGRRGQTLVLREAIRARYDVGDPNAPLFEARYEALIAMYFQPIDC